MTANMLNLPQYRVLHVDESEHDYHTIPRSNLNRLPARIAAH